MLYLKQIISQSTKKASPQPDDHGFRGRYIFVNTFFLSLYSSIMLPFRSKNGLTITTCSRHYRGFIKTIISAWIWQPYKVYITINLLEMPERSLSTAFPETTAALAKCRLKHSLS